MKFYLYFHYFKFKIPRPKIQINRLSIFDGKTGLEANGSDSKQTVTEDKN